MNLINRIFPIEGIVICQEMIDILLKIIAG